MSVRLRQLRASRTPCGLGGALEGTLPRHAAALGVELGARGRVKTPRSIEEAEVLVDKSLDVGHIIQHLNNQELGRLGGGAPGRAGGVGEKVEFVIPDECLPFPQLDLTSPPLLGPSPTAAQIQQCMQHAGNRLYSQALSELPKEEDYQQLTEEEDFNFKVLCGVWGVGHLVEAHRALTSTRFTSQPCLPLDCENTRDIMLSLRMGAYDCHLPPLHVTLRGQEDMALVMQCMAEFNKGVLITGALEDMRCGFIPSLTSSDAQAATMTSTVEVYATTVSGVRLNDTSKLPPITKYDGNEQMVDNLLKALTSTSRVKSGFHGHVGVCVDPAIPGHLPALLRVARRANERVKRRFALEDSSRPFEVTVVPLRPSGAPKDGSEGSSTNVGGAGGAFICLFVYLTKPRNMHLLQRACADLVQPPLVLGPDMRTYDALWTGVDVMRLLMRRYPVQRMSTHTQQAYHLTYQALYCLACAWLPAKHRFSNIMSVDALQQDIYRPSPRDRMTDWLAGGLLLRDLRVDAWLQEDQDQPWNTAEIPTLEHVYGQSCVQHEPSESNEM